VAAVWNPDACACAARPLSGRRRLLPQTWKLVITCDWIRINVHSRLVHKQVGAHISTWMILPHLVIPRRCLLYRVSLL
jgi:hypothetical protein